MILQDYEGVGPQKRQRNLLVSSRKEPGFPTGGLANRVSLKRDDLFKRQER